MEVNKLYFEDCYDTLQRIPDGGVDLLLQDTPFECTQNDWDIKPDLKKMWPEWLRVAKQNAAIIFFATQPFASELIYSNPKLFRYDLIWYKLGKATGFLNANKMPLRSHEHILIFYRELPTYNPQKLKGKHNHSKGSHSRGHKQTNNNYGNFDQSFESPPTNDKFPLSVIEFASVHPPIHPTQKPIDLIRWLIRTYTNEGETVFDGYCGSGTVPEGCIMENRNFICSENNRNFFDLSQHRIKVRLSQPVLF